MCYAVRRMNKYLFPLAIIAGIALIALSVQYFTTPANALPHWVPGFDASLTKIHTKHAIAALLLGLASLAYAWFASKPSAEPKHE